MHFIAGVKRNSFPGNTYVASILLHLKANFSYSDGRHTANSCPATSFAGTSNWNRHTRFADVSQAWPAGQHSLVKPEHLEYISWYIQKPLKQVARQLVKKSF